MAIGHISHPSTNPLHMRSETDPMDLFSARILPMADLYYGRLLEHRAELAQASGGEGEEREFLRLAEESYLQGLRANYRPDVFRGMPHTNPNEPALEGLYERLHGKGEGFANHIAAAKDEGWEERRDSAVAQRTDDTQPREPFVLETLDGEEVRSDQFLDQVRMWMEARGHDFPVLWNDGYVRRAGGQGFPTTRVADQAGRLAFSWVGGDANRFAQELTWRVEALLERSPSPSARHLAEGKSGPYPWRMRTETTRSTCSPLPKTAILILVSLLSQACDSNPTEAQGVEIAPTPGLQGFEAELDALRVDLWVPGMAAAIAQDGQIVWSRGFGLADVEDQVQASPTTPFHLASLTKPFGATILMQLVEEGLLSLDDPVSEHGVTVQSSGIVRVRHLLTHTSEGEPGSQYSYNGNRFGLLDQVIQNASGRSFGELLVERILQPLGLTDTAPNPRDPQEFERTGLNRTQFMARMAAGYQRTAGSVMPTEHPSYFGTAAGLVASAEDMAGFSIAIDQGLFLTPETWQAVFTPAVSNGGQTLPYGLGWFIHYHEGVKLEWHYGHWTSNSSLIVRAPSMGLTFVVLANTPELSARYGLGRDGNVLRSDVAKLFVDSFVLGNEPLPVPGH